MKISIVVPAYNEEKLLPATLRSIKSAAQAFDGHGWAFELIVCNNNSTDGTAEVAEREGARVVFEPINQIARARNCGAEAATGAWLLFIDADSHPPRELFEDVIKAIESGEYVAGGATVKLDAWFPGMWSVTTIWNITSRLKKWCAGSFIFCDAQAFRAIGGFSSELFVSEELDLSIRLRAYGKKRGKRITILSRHPLVTSSRKVTLYGHRAHLKFLFKLIMGHNRVVRQREECAIWYDGKR